MFDFKMFVQSVIAKKDTDYDADTAKDGKTKEVAIANVDTTWNEPSSAYAATYPKNHVYETESGHIQEFDDTTDNERIHEYHKAGTFYEIDKDGNKSTRIVGDNYEVIAKDNNVNVKGNVNLTIDTNCNTYIKCNWNIQVDGSKTEVVTGAVTETYKDTKTETVTGAVSETYKANQTTNITGTLDLDASTEVDIDAATINMN